MSWIRWSVIPRLFLLLLTAGFLLTALSRPVAAQQDISDSEWTELYDNGGFTDVSGYAEVDVSPDATMMDAYAVTSLTYDGGDQSWYGAALTATITCNNQEIDSNTQLYDGSGGYLEADFEETTQPGDQWELTAGYGTYYVVYCDPMSGSGWCDPTYSVSSDLALTVGDPSPVIDSISCDNTGNTLIEGEENECVMYGSGFGTSTPTLKVDDPSITLSAPFDASDTQVSFSADPTLGDLTTSAGFTIQSNSFSQGTPASGQSSTSAKYPFPISTNETVQIDGVTLSQSSINAITPPTSTTATVSVLHSDSGNLAVATVDVNIATYTQSPSGNAVSYPVTVKTVSVQAAGAGHSTVQFTVNAIQGTTVQGSVGIGVWLTNPQPSGNVTIVQPNPTSIAQITLGTTPN